MHQQPYRFIFSCLALTVVTLGLLTAADAAAVEREPWDEDTDTQPDILPGELGQTWVEIGGVVYGARPDERGPIGGGEGYQLLVTNGDYVINPNDDRLDIDELLEALSEAQPGETVFIPGNAVLDFTVRMFTEENFVVEIPEGVTLASDRGYNGSRGALLLSHAMDTKPLIKVTGPNVRITGLRIEGPDKRIRDDELRRVFNKGGRSLYYKFPTAYGITCYEQDGMELDNNQIFGWTYATHFRGSSGHRVHHNHLHHNSRRGLGYGVSLDQSVVLIEHNLFDYHRHAIVSTGKPGSSYEARHNVVLRNAGGGRCHSFDMHGGRVSEKDKAWIREHHEQEPDLRQYVAGDWIKVHHNQFRMTHFEAVRIRGTPIVGAEVHHNWFYHEQPGGDVIDCGGNIEVFENVYGETPERKPEDPGYAKYPADN